MLKDLFDIFISSNFSINSTFLFDYYFSNRLSIEHLKNIFYCLHKRNRAFLHTFWFICTENIPGSSLARDVC